MTGSNSGVFVYIVERHGGLLMRFLFLAIIFLSMLVSCANRGGLRNFNQVRVGETHIDELYRSFGNPDDEEEGFACWNDRLVSGWGWDRADKCVWYDEDGYITKKKQKTTYRQSHDRTDVYIH